MALAAPPKAQKTRKQSMEFAQKLDMQSISRHVDEIQRRDSLSLVPSSPAATTNTAPIIHDRKISVSFDYQDNDNPFISQAASTSTPTAVAASSSSSSATMSPTNANAQALPTPPMHRPKSLSVSDIRPVPMIWQGKLFYYIGQKPIKSGDWRAAWVTLQDHRLSAVEVDDPSKQVFNVSICIGCGVEKCEEISKASDRSKWGFVFSLECTQSNLEMYFVAETDEKGKQWVNKVYDARHLTHWLAPHERQDLQKSLQQKAVTVEEFSLLNS